MAITKSKAAEIYGVTKYQIKAEVEKCGASNLSWLTYRTGDRPDQRWAMVNPDDPTWLEFVMACNEKKNRKALGISAPIVKNTGVPSVMDPTLQKLEKKSVAAQLEMPIVKLKHEKFKARAAENRIKKEEGDLIPYQLSEVYFFGFADRLATEALRTGPKLRRRIREGIAATFIQRIPDAGLSPEVDKAVREFLKGEDVHALSVEVEKMVVEEIEGAVRSVKKDQRISVEKWQEEGGTR